MTVSEFWNQALLAALHRLPASKAVAEANRATDECIKHWKDSVFDYAPITLLRRNVDVTEARDPESRISDGKKIKPHKRNSIRRKKSQSPSASDNAKS
jgi:hypothetical protein